jgi:hypothetical protein
MFGGVMAYRDSSDDPERAKREAAKERLIALAEEENPASKLASKAEKRAQREKLAQERTTQSRNKVRVRDSIAGNVTLKRILFWVMSPLGLGIGFGLVEFEPLIGIPFVSFYIGGMIWSLIGPVLLVRREKQWLQLMPFSVGGYFESLGFYERFTAQDPAVKLSVHLKSGSTRPELELVQKLFARLSANVQVAEATITIDRKNLKTSYMWHEPGYTHYSNREMRVYLRSVLKDILLPFHEAYPIQEISIIAYS